MKKKQLILRGVFYIAGIVIACIGLILITKTNLGVSTISSLPYSLSQRFPLSYPTFLFLMYLVMAGIQILILGRKQAPRILLQIVASYLLSFILSLIEGFFESFTLEGLWQRVLFVLISNLFVGVGAYIMVAVRISSAPSEGLAELIGTRIKKDFGTGKNILDFICVALAAICDLVFNKRLVSVGLGTVITMIMLGRVIAVTERLIGKPLRCLVGLEEKTSEPTT